MTGFKLFADLLFQVQINSGNARVSKENYQCGVAEKALFLNRLFDELGQVCYRPLPPPFIVTFGIVNYLRATLQEESFKIFCTVAFEIIRATAIWRTDSPTRRNR